MPRISHRFITSGIFLIAALVLAGAALYSAHTHIALADAAHSDWAQVWPVPPTPDGPDNLWDVGPNPCTNGSNCTWGSCDASNPGFSGVSTQCDSWTCKNARFAYNHSFQCTYTPATGATCTPDDASTCAANTCTTDPACTGTRADCSTYSVSGTKNCTVSCSVYNSCGSLHNDGIIVNGACNATAPSEATCVQPPATCANGASDPPTCTPPPASCANGATDPPTCTPPSASCANGASDPPTCTPPPNPDSGGPGGTCSNPTARITASATRVKSGQPITLSVTASGISHTCTVTGTGSGATLNQTLTPATCALTPNPTTITTPPITTQSTFTVTCGDVSDTTNTKVIINLNPVFTPF